MLPEAQLDAVTALSGSGPAYVFLLAEAMIDAGVFVGLTRPVAVELAVQTIVGSALMLRDSGDSAAQLREAVTSPGGTTAAALKQLWLLAYREAQVQTFADAYLAIAVCFALAVVMVPLMRKVVRPKAPPEPAH